MHIADVVGRPVALRHIVEGAGIGLIRLDLLGQQAGEHGGHFGAGHVALRPEGAVGIAHQEGEVVGAVQLRGLAVDEGHGRIGLAVHRDAGTADGEGVGFIGEHIALRGFLFQQGVGTAGNIRKAHSAAGVGGGLIGLPAPAVLQHEGGPGKGLALSVGLVGCDGRAGGSATAAAGAAGIGVGEGHLIRQNLGVHIIDAVVTLHPLGGVDDKAVVRVRLRLRISRLIIDQRRICIYDDIAALRIGSFRQDVPYRVVIRPVGASGVLFPDIEALADKRFHLIRRAGDEQSAIVIACAVGGDSSGVEITVICQIPVAYIKDLQLEGLPAGSGVAAQLHRLGEGELIARAVVGVGKLRFWVIRIISGIMDI